MNSETKMRPVTTLSHCETSEGPSEERRSFLGILIGLIASGITAVLGVNIGRYSIAPALSAAGQPEWTEAGLLDEIPEDEPVKRYVVISQEAGWGRFNSQRLVWVLKKGTEITVFWPCARIWDALSIKRNVGSSVPATVRPGTRKATGWAVPPPEAWTYSNIASRAICSR